jgi:tetratricopeptide (TPR) repeat protein
LYAEVDRISKTPSSLLESWELVNKARPLFYSQNGLEEMIELLAKAIQKDPGYVEAHALMAMYYSYEALMGRFDLIEKAEASAQKAMQLDPNHEMALLASVAANLNLQRFDVAKTLAKRAIEVNPNFATAHAWYGFSLGCVGEATLGLQALEQAFLLSPRDEQIYLWHYFAGLCHAAAGDFHAAVQSGHNSVTHYGGWFFTWVIYAANLAMIEDYDKARSAWQNAKKLFPEWSLGMYKIALAGSPLPQETNAAFLEALAAAGIE